MIRRPPRSTPFPTRRSSDLFGHHHRDVAQVVRAKCRPDHRVVLQQERDQPFVAGVGIVLAGEDWHGPPALAEHDRSEEHTSELQSLAYLVCRLLLEKKKKKK